MKKPFLILLLFNFCTTAFAEAENRPLPDHYGRRLRGKTFGIVVDDAIVVVE